MSKYHITIYSELDEKLLHLASSFGLLLIGGTAIELLMAEVKLHCPNVFEQELEPRIRSDNDFDFLLTMELEIDKNQLANELNSLGFRRLGGSLEEAICFMEAKDRKGKAIQADFLNDFSPEASYEYHTICDLKVVRPKKLAQMKQQRMDEMKSLGTATATTDKSDIRLLQQLHKIFQKHPNISTEQLGYLNAGGYIGGRFNFLLKQNTTIMNYWHMQIHPNRTMPWGVSEIINLLNEGLIGMGEWEENIANNPQQKYFMDEIAVGDIVLVRNGATPIALTEVIGDAEYLEDNYIGGWIVRQRKVKVLEFYDEKKHSKKFPAPLGTLSRCANLNTATSKVIVDWHNRTIAEKKS